MANRRLRGPVLMTLGLYPPSPIDSWQTRDVAHRVFRTSWATQDEMDAVRGALARLVAAGLVVGGGSNFAHWRLTEAGRREAEVLWERERLARNRFT